MASWPYRQVLKNQTRVAGLLAADGGYRADDIYGNLPQIGWQKLIHLFLRT